MAFGTAGRHSGLRRAYRRRCLLDGIVGVYRPEAVKMKHKATIWGMYVRAGERGLGVGVALLDEAIVNATAAVEEINLTVGVSNVSPCRLYNRAGFRQYDLERRALKIGDRYYDEALMSLVLSRA